MLQKFQNHIDKNLPFLKESKLLLAISGGMDSVILAYLCKSIGLDIAFAHCNFKLRAEESDNDERFVDALGLKLNVETFIQEFDTKNYANEHKLSIQVAARELRYQWFKELREQLSYDFILTAHHADDNLETFLINLSRGTGIEGLTGIPEVNETIVRPLLPFTRQELVDYAKESCINWREDASNAETKYLRNKIRHEVVPILKGINPQLIQNFHKTLHHLQESQSIINDRIDEVSDTVLTVENDSIKLNINELKKFNNPKAYLYELLKDYGFTEWNDVEALLDAQSGKYVLSDNWRLLKDRDFLILYELNNGFSSSAVERLFIKQNDNSVQTPLGLLFIEEVNEVSKSDSNSIYVDKDKLSFPLTLRKHKEGDVFYPFGMKGKKKLSKYFKDEKMSMLDKENVLLLVSGDQIVWVVGMRGDDRFKVTDKTRAILKISVQ